MGLIKLCYLIVEPGDDEMQCMISNDMVKELLKLSVPIVSCILKNKFS